MNRFARSVGFALAIGLAANGCSAESVPTSVTIDDCVQKSTGDAVDLNVVSVEEAIRLSMCVADRLDSNTSKQLTKYVSTFSPASLEFDHEEQKYKTVPHDAAKTGPYVVFVGQELIESQDDTFRQLADPNHWLAGALKKDPNGRQTMYLSAPTLVSPSVKTFTFWHYARHLYLQSLSGNEKPDCENEEVDILEFMHGVFMASDSRNHIWTKKQSELISVGLDTLGQLSYSFGNGLSEPPITSHDTTQKSSGNFNIWQSNALETGAILQPHRSPEEQKALLSASAIHHCQALRAI
jgi:hypothetical protein